ncbi:cytochrome b560 subunit of succinate dehydrogenase [Conidiobolus coronatus NRRL 28638]|uniref:Cytochrome b560 subunit of succinate dehydrogenase n=1 Tax=Conidiobolus coronatus (strain ATCC 28846 / CBS 209.66 / NRRL 28638) TaxID=796925 RepID=A0A137PIK0_CONC2|nr:cytochrome b560 subunit of succinate dehydrogenase [Conidiobolus coronatus NRRL 28638]|eukprot:KXN74823.1 cytochrome b560 subunit of succinate dehydrogenase [Conidiobolus coronatus NRRL 28638]
MNSITRTLAQPHIRALSRQVLFPRLAQVNTFKTCTQSFQQNSNPTTPHLSKQLLELREKRPRSPNFTIYQPQLTWIMSIFYRVSGVAVTGMFAGAAIAAPVFGVTSEVAAEFVSELPSVVKVLGKLVLTVPFTYHFWGGIRHLIWDSTRALALKGVYSTGYFTLAATVVSSLALTAL